MEVKRAAAGGLWVQIDLEGLGHAVGLHEVPLVVHVEAMVSGVTLQVGDETWHIDERQQKPPGTTIYRARFFGLSCAA